jgi:hypothetical protein
VHIAGRLERYEDVWATTLLKQDLLDSPAIEAIGIGAFVFAGYGLVISLDPHFLAKLRVLSEFGLLHRTRSERI